MLRKLNKDFCNALEQVCKKNITLNDTLKKYETLQELVAQKQLSQAGADDSMESLLATSTAFIDNNLNLNEIYLLLAIKASTEAKQHLLSDEICSFDAGLSLLLLG